MDRLHKALANLIFTTGALCEVGVVAEDQIQKLIDHTKEFIEHVFKPAMASGMDPERWKELQRQQREFHDLTASPAFQKKLTPEQHKEITDLIRSLPWDTESGQGVRIVPQTLNPPPRVPQTRALPPAAPQTFKPPNQVDNQTPPKHEEPKKPDC